MSLTAVNIGAAPNDGSGSPLRTAFQQTNTNTTLLGGGFQTPTTLAAGSSALVANKNYATTLAGNVVYQPLPGGEDGDWIEVIYNVTAPSSIDLHTNSTVYRTGGGLITSGISFAVGTHKLTLRKAGGRWVAEWTGSQQTGGVVELRRQGLDAVQFAAPTPDETGNGLALMAALAKANLTPAVKADIHLRHGRFFIPTGTNLRSFAPAAVDLAIVFEGRAAVVYDDPLDACNDHMFYRGERNVLNFGAVRREEDPLADATKAIQAALDSLRLYSSDPHYQLASGRMMRMGSVYIPNGTYTLSSEIFYSPSITLRGESPRGVMLFLADNTFTNPLVEQFALTWDGPANPPPVGFAPNNAFGTCLSNFYLAGGGHINNPGGSGIKFSGAQGSSIRGVIVEGFALRGIEAQGGCLYNVWISTIRRGPGLDWFSGGYADLLSVEHINYEATPDTVSPYGYPGRIYPAIRLTGGNFHICQAQGEEAIFDPGVPGSIPPTVYPQVLVEVVNVAVGTFDQVIMGIASRDQTTINNTLLRITGTTEYVNAKQIYGSYQGGFPQYAGKLVVDDSAGSPAGKNVLFTLAGAFNTVTPKSYKSGYESQNTETITVSANNPTLADPNPANAVQDNILPGQKRIWHNTTLNETREWVHVGGVLKKSAPYT